MCVFVLSRGHNQRMEFLGDSIMQLVATEYLFIHFPDHHEGHLTVKSHISFSLLSAHTRTRAPVHTHDTPIVETRS